MKVVLLNYLEAAFLEDEHHIKSEVIRQCLLQKSSENKGMQKLRTCCSDSLPFQYIFSVCSIPLDASVMLSPCAKLSSHVLAIRERERERQTSKEQCLP